MNKRHVPIVPITLVIAAVAVIGAVVLRISSPNAQRTSSVPWESSVVSSGLSGESVAGRPSFAQDKAIAVPFPVPPMTAGDTAAVAEPRVIKTGSLNVAVQHVDETVTSLRVLARSETTAAQDVTEQYTDLEAQLRNARAQEQEYLNILKRAQTVQDILNVQQYLGSIRAQIESLQGRIKYLENATSYATLSIFLSEDTRVRAPSAGFRPLQDARAAMQALVLLFQALMTWVIWLVIVGIGTLVPLGLIVWVLFVLIRRLVRRHRR